MKIINIENWKRKEHFDFFSKMVSPFFGVVAEVDCTKCYDNAKNKGESFFATYLHRSMIAINTVEELKYRIVNDKVVAYKVIHAGTTIARADGTFGFAYVPFDLDFKNFNTALQHEIYAVQNSTGLRLKNEDLNVDLIRHSTFPWNSFSGLLHPTNLDSKDSVPKITFGKFAIKEGRKMMPVSIEAHHGLADGLHLAHYLKEFQNQLDAD